MNLKPTHGWMPTSPRTRSLFQNRQRRLTLLFGLLCGLLLSGLIIGLGSPIALAQQSPPFNPENVPVPSHPPLALVGEGIYEQSCAACHGFRGMGDGPVALQLTLPPTRFGDPLPTWNKTPAEWFHATKFGRIENLMPPWQNSLSDDQIWQVVAYAWELRTTPTQVTQGRRLYEQNCAACHGPQGLGDGPEAPSPLRNFADPALMMTLSQGQLWQGWRDAHPEIGENWAVEQSEAVLAYVRTFTLRPSWTFVMDQGPGTIEGQVVQGSVGGGPFSGPVTLEAFAGNRPLGTFEQSVAEDGRFRFDNLPVESGLVYLLTATYNNVRYASAPLAFAGEIASLGPASPTPAPLAEGERNTLIRADLPIYEVTQDLSGLRGDRVNLIVEQAPGALLIGQLFFLGNQGDRAVVGRTVEGVPVPVTVALPIPAGAQEIGFQDGDLGEEYWRVGDRIYDTRPVVPGEFSRQIFVRYRLPFEGRSVDLAQLMPFPVPELNVLVAELPNLQSQIGLSEGEMIFVGRQNLQGAEYSQWSGSLSANTTLSLSLQGVLAQGDTDPRQIAPTGGGLLPPAVASPVTQIDRPIALAVGGLIGLLFVGVLGFFWWRNRRETGQPSLDLASQRIQLLQAIADLDDRHSMGQMTDAQWQQGRARLKGELLAVAAQMEAQSGQESKR